MGIAVSSLPIVIPSKRSKLKPVPIVKVCKPPCNGKRPCIRICKACNFELDPKKLKSRASGCKYLEDHVAKTFLGNSTGISYLSRR